MCIRHIDIRRETIRRETPDQKLENRLFFPKRFFNVILPGKFEIFICPIQKIPGDQMGLFCFLLRPDPFFLV
jgi:hypothetical protein